MTMSDSKAPAEFSFLDLPDDEVENHRPGDTAAVAVVAPVVAESGEAADDADAGNDAGAASESSPAAVEEAADAKVETEVVVADKTPAKPAAVEVKPAVEADPAKVEAKPADVAKPAVAAAVDYKAEYDRMLAPFKANGKDIAVNSVDDAISLMQMGANYNKKMAALKPNLMLLKLLESNGLLSEEKIGYLIDLTKKDPGAINKLVKDSGLDPLELDADKAAGYKPTVRKIDEREVELDAVLDEIQTTPSYQRTIEIVSKEWDGPSKQVIADSPQLLKVINQHVQAGIYDLISTEVERERMFGRLQGLSDLQAYKQVGDAVQARGGFDHLGSVPQGQPNTPKPVVVVPNTLKEEELKDKKRAASSPKPLPAAATPKDFNPLSMSDAEFSKLAQSRYA